MMWYALGFVPIEFIEVARLLMGPLPEFICLTQFFLKNSLVSFGIVLCLDALVVFRVIYYFS